MRLSRRTFFGSLAALGVSLGAGKSVAVPKPKAASTQKTTRPWNYVQVELGPGPWPLIGLADQIALLLHALQVKPPARLSAIGDVPENGLLPREFAITLHYEDGLRLVFVARTWAEEPGLVTIRSKYGTPRFNLFELDPEPPVPEELSELGAGLAAEAWATLARRA